MKKKVLIATNNDIYMNALTEVFAEETDFDSPLRFDDNQEYNYNTIDLVIIDDDIALITNIRELGYKKAIFALISINDDEINFKAMDSGATDVMVKPFMFEAFLTRVRSAICSEENTFDGIITINNFVFMPKSRILRYIDKEVRLTEKEAAIISLLHKTKPAHVDRLTILKEIWGYGTGISTHTLETHIYHLRQKIETVTNEKLIVTTDDGYALSS